MSTAIYNFRRAELERWIDRAIELLDDIDGNPDLEDDEIEDDEIEDLPKVEPVRAKAKRRIAA